MTDNGIQFALGEIGATLKSIEKKLDSHSERMNSHSERLRTVEHRQHWYAGAAAVVGLAGSYLFRVMKGLSG